MSQENVEVVRRAIDAFNQRDVDDMVRDWDPEIEVDWSQSRGLEAGIYRGQEAVLGLWRTFLETFDRATVSPDEFIECREHVVVPNRTHFRGRNHVEVEARSALVVTLRNGRIVKWRLYQERAEALDAVGLSDVGTAATMHGHCDARFTALRAAFADNFGRRDELGAAISVLLDGRVVVDVWAGWADVARTRPWHHDTLVGVFSVGKAMAATCVLLLAERREVDLDAPVARYWPEFAAAGKEEVTVRTLLAHRAGLPAVRRDVTPEEIYDWESMASALAAEEPWWEPGTTHGYHVNTLGFLAGEIVRRVSGESIGAFFRREVAEPLELDFHFGVPAADDARVAEYAFGADSSAEDRRAAQAGPERRFLFDRVYLNPPELSGIGTVNTRAWRAAEIPSANGHGTARAVAGFYAALGRGVLAPETLREATTEHSAGNDFVLARPSRFGLGFQLTQPERRLGPGPAGFGHFGVGGSLGFADPEAGLAFGYVMNRSVPGWLNPRNRALIDAVYACL